MIVGANTTARFFGDIWNWLGDLFQEDSKGRGAYQVLALSAGHAHEVEHEELETVTVLRGEHVERLPQVIAALLVGWNR